MKLKRNKLVSLFLVFSLSVLSANLYAKEKRGAKLIIQKKGDQVRQVENTRYKNTPWEPSVMTGIRGEIIAVKPNSLLLLDTEGKDVSIDIADIKVITIVKKSKMLQGSGIGLFVGGTAGAILGFADGDDEPGCFTFTAEQKALVLGIFLGFTGLCFGGIAGLKSGKDETILLEGMSDFEIEKALEKLRKKARIRDYK
jgi:hypothetical protein